MAHTALNGSPVTLRGTFPAPGTPAPAFTLTSGDLGEITLAQYAGRTVILNIFPSVDTPVCAATVRRFNQACGSLDNTVVLCVSMDLPFAQTRFCGAEGLRNVTTLSAFRHRAFATAYGVAIDDGPLAGLCARAVVIIDQQATVVYSQLVDEITSEPDYDRALQALA